MKISTFRILNCFGFADSGLIELSTARDFLYILGRNSSGKSSLLNAIRYFAYGEVPSEKPNFRNFEPSSGWSGFDVGFSFGRSKLDSSLFESEFRKLFELHGISHKIFNEHPPNFELYEKSLEIYKTLIQDCNSSKGCVVTKYHDGDYGFRLGDDTKRLTERISRIKVLIDAASNADGLFLSGGVWREMNFNEYSFEEILFSQFPNIALFNESFGLAENLPNTIDRGWRKSVNEHTKSFMRVLGEDLIDELLVATIPAKINILETKIRENLHEFVQIVNASAKKRKGFDLIKVDIRFSGDGLQITFYTDDKPSYYSQMSDNTKFLFAYHLHQATAGISGNILLFDEPNNGFHPTAQRQLLKFLQDLAKNGNQVIVSTHSEHLIDTDYLAGVRIMSSDAEKKLTVRNHFYDRPKGSGDYLALQPIYDAIGQQFGSQIAIKDKIVITEGVTDLLYIRAFCHILGDRKPLALAPARGDGQIAHLVSFMIAQNFRYKVVLDKGKVREKLQKDYGIDSIYIFEIPVPEPYAKTVHGSGIEDSFSKKDFAMVLLNIGHKVDDDFLKVTNGNYIKRLDPTNTKRLVAHGFYENASSFKKTDFDRETLDNFNDIIKFCRNSNWFSL